MKKMIIFFSLLIVLCFTSCKSQEEKALEKFLNSPNLQTDIMLRMEQDYTAVEQTLCELKINSEEMSILLYQAESTIYINTNNNTIYYSNKNGKYYSIINNQNIMDSIPISTYTKEKDLDIFDYIINITYSTNYFSFDLDFKKMLVDNIDEPNKELYDDINIPAINCFGTIKEGLVNSFTVDFTNILSLLGDLGYSVEGKLFICLENINYVDEVKPLNSIKESDFLYKSPDFIVGQITQDIENLYNENKEPIQPTYRIGWIEKNYNIKVNEPLILNGYLYDINYNYIYLNYCDITYTPELDLSKLGKTEYTISINYDDYEFTEKINVNIVGETIKSDEEIKIIENGITKTFRVNNFLLICDINTMYKYNLENNTIEGSVDLKCQANSIYVKDGYVYVAANFPAVGYDFNNLQGTITKINLDNFTITKQMIVDFYPYSIFVDNRNNILVGKGEDQHIKYSSINIDTEEITHLEHLYGYENDYLIYSEEKDAFMSITTNHTGDNPWYKFNGTTYENTNSSITNINYLSYIYNNGEIIIESTYGNLVLGSFNSGINDYSFKNYEFYYEKSNYVNSTLVTYNDNKVYCLTSYDDLLKGTFCILDLETDYITSFDIDILSSNIESINYYNGKIYVCYTDGFILETFPIE